MRTLSTYRMFVSSILLLGSLGCASVPQTRSLEMDRGDLPETHQILGVPLIEQTENYCGPASLAMLARFTKIEVSTDALGAMMFTPAKKGTLQLDFIGAARRMGLLTLPITNLRNLLTEITENRPVAVLLNFGSTRNPQWHYAVVTGFHISDERIILHSGEKEPLNMRMSQFERSWQKADYWGLLALNPPELPKTVPIEEIVKAAAILERIPKTKEANVAYDAVLKRWPNQLGALFGLGNTFAQLGDLEQSARAFERASELKPDSAAIWNNLAQIYLRQNRKKNAAIALKKAKQLENFSTLK